MSLEKNNVSHTELVLAARDADTSDLNPEQRSRQAFQTDVSLARQNLEETFPGAERNAYLAAQLAWTVMLERDRRHAHSYRYRLMTRAALNGPLLGMNDNLPEASLLDIQARTSAMSDADWAMAAMYSGKGVSAEIGHVDQLGNWGAGRVLDDAVRQLPRSEPLAKAGFVFGETYDSKDSARIGYEFYITDGGLKAKRKRAAADVMTENGTIYNLIKTSTYLIDETVLSSEDFAMARSVKRQLKDDNLKPEEISERDKVFAEAGRTIVEPFISDPERRTRSTAVLAATSLYFALVRHR